MPNMSGCCIESLSCPNGLKPVSFIPGIPLALKRSEVFLEGLILGIILDGENTPDLLSDRKSISVKSRRQVSSSRDSSAGVVQLRDVRYPTIPQFIVLYAGVHQWL